MTQIFKRTNLEEKQEPSARIDRRHVVCGAALGLAMQGLVAPGLSWAASSATRPSFNALWSAYPRSDRESFYNSLGGEWPSLVDNPSYRNTCAVRTSAALNGAGHLIPDSAREAVTGDGRNIILRVRSMHSYLKGLLGDQSWGMSKKPGDAVTLPTRTGIILYHANFSDASGHVDLWNGTQFAGQVDVWQGIELSGNSDMHDLDTAAFEIGIWFLK
ncbi:T6SS effector amidase Tae4 family protein [Roseibium sp. RKSG952]|uniref:T6SS effector amidase Tae4 family protein n=1 Tax=Roseibium sp. RKSG952 TaxID=2529384 RepID=UPI0012BBC691|nr:T6SS effector amidase Tae4 family protein [Roseibium sp. RKSG952]MTH95052.1 hypothetical protein [Roseibium sp. RKSG952]